MGDGADVPSQPCRGNAQVDCRYVVAPPRHGPTGPNEGRAPTKRRANSRPRGDHPADATATELSATAEFTPALKGTRMSPNADPTPRPHSSPPAAGTS